MPLYEYICRKCSYEFEEIQKFSDKPIKKCPKCSKMSVSKKVSLSAFSLKGEGWYKDGYSRPSEKPKTESKKTSSSDTKKTPPITKTKTATAGSSQSTST